jgi:hypothetical protein
MEVVHRERVVSGLTFLFALAMFEISYCVVADVLTFIEHEPSALFFVYASVVDATLVATSFALLAAGTRSTASCIVLALTGFALNAINAVGWYDNEHRFIDETLHTFVDRTLIFPDTLFLAACLWIAVSFAQREWTIALALVALGLRAFSSEMQLTRFAWGQIDLATYQDPTLRMVGLATSYGTSLAFLILWWLARIAVNRQLKNGSSSPSSKSSPESSRSN